MSTGKRYAMVMDLDLCVGCRGCEVACRQEHDLKPRLGETIDIRTRPIPNYTQVITVGPQGQFPDLDMWYVPRLCNHCTDAPCVAMCPTGAMTVREDGIVCINHEKCISCLHCLHACPFQAIHYDKDDDVVGKCDFCEHLVDYGEEPACVAVCMTRCRIFGDLNDPQSEVSRLLVAHGPSLMPLPLPWGSSARPNVFYLRKKKAHAAC